MTGYFQEDMNLEIRKERECLSILVVSNQISRINYLLKTQENGLTVIFLEM
jgi:hypothetical protein